MKIFLKGLVGLSQCHDVKKVDVGLIWICDVEGGVERDRGFIDMCNG